MCNCWCRYDGSCLYFRKWGLCWFVTFEVRLFTMLILFINAFIFSERSGFRNRCSVWRWTFKHVRDVEVQNALVEQSPLLWEQFIDKQNHEEKAVISVQVCQQHQSSTCDHFISFSLRPGYLQHSWMNCTCTSCRDTSFEDSGPAFLSGTAFVLYWSFTKYTFHCFLWLLRCVWEKTDLHNILLQISSSPSNDLFKISGW